MRDSECISEGTMDAWLQGNVGGDSGKAIEEHFATCAQCMSLRDECIRKNDSVLKHLRAPITSGEDGTNKTEAREPTTSNSRRIEIKTPTTIGPYHVLETIGEGGMGVVYLAEQTTPIKRVVALKFIKPGLVDSESMLARFEAERQVLSLMDHPNIATVLDAGQTPDGRPYFVMEYVEGESITQYCDKHALSTTERLRLFSTVCAGVQHAHRKGIIHRDIKPSNVLVTVHDNLAVPKIIDFGVAKATAQALVESAPQTQHGALVGTLDYMSPEQAAGSSDIDTRSDVYSLGVLLYELVVGMTPFDTTALLKVSFAELLRVIQQDPPPPPGTRIRSLGLDADTIAQCRSTTHKTWIHDHRRELDWIILRALENVNGV